jgi:hypothetical protein
MPEPHSHSSPLSVHDNNVYRYTVDCAGRSVLLHTCNQHREQQTFVDVVFRGVVAHHFEHVLKSNILFDIEEIDAANFVQQNAELFGRTWRYAWPLLDYEGQLDVLAEKIRLVPTKAFNICSSFGLSGWVLAERFELQLRGGKILDG